LRGTTATGRMPREKAKAIHLKIFKNVFFLAKREYSGEYG
jgi:hypothetical protein